MEQNVQVGKFGRIWGFRKSKIVLGGPKSDLSTNKVKNDWNEYIIFKVGWFKV